MAHFGDSLSRQSIALLRTTRNNETKLENVAIVKALQLEV